MTADLLEGLFDRRVDEQDRRALLIGHATAIVAAFVGRNPMRASEIHGLIESVHRSLLLQWQADRVPGGEEVFMPAVSVGESVRTDHLVCLEDGMRFQALRRHLRTAHGLSPDEYRKKWNLPANYPMVAPDYSKKRARIWKQQRQKPPQ